MVPGWGGAPALGKRCPARSQRVTRVAAWVVVSEAGDHKLLPHVAGTRRVASCVAWARSQRGGWVPRGPGEAAPFTAEPGKSHRARSPRASPVLYNSPGRALPKASLPRPPAPWGRQCPSGAVPPASAHSLALSCGIRETLLVPTCAMAPGRLQPERPRGRVPHPWNTGPRLPSSSCEAGFPRLPQRGPVSAGVDTARERRAPRAGEQGLRPQGSWLPGGPRSPARSRSRCQQGTSVREGQLPSPWAGGSPCHPLPLGPSAGL